MSSIKTTALSVAPQDEEFVLIQKLKKLQDQKESKSSTVDLKVQGESCGLNSIQSSIIPKSHQKIHVQLAYGFTIVPSTSTALTSSVALTPMSDGAYNTYWKNIFNSVDVHSAKLVLDFHEYANLTGVSDPIRPLTWVYDPTAYYLSGYPTFDQMSDWEGVQNIPWSSANPVVSFNVPEKTLKNVNFTNTTADSYTHPGPIPTRVEPVVAKGAIRLASKGVFCAGTSGRVIHGRLLVNCSFSFKIGGA